MHRISNSGYTPLSSLPLPATFVDQHATITALRLSTRPPTLSSKMSERSSTVKNTVAAQSMDTASINPSVSFSQQDPPTSIFFPCSSSYANSNANSKQVSNRVEVIIQEVFVRLPKMSSKPSHVEGGSRPQKLRLEVSYTSRTCL